MKTGLSSTGKKRVHSTKVTEPKAKNAERDSKSHAFALPANTYTQAITCGQIAILLGRKVRIGIVEPLKVMGPSG